MRIGILGSGLMGAKLGRLWAECGHDVTFSYSRSQARLERLARDAGGSHAPVAETVAGADALLLAVHWPRVGDVLDQAGDMAGKLVLNGCVPLDARDRDRVVGRTSSAAEELARMRPAARWVSCFNTTLSEGFHPAFARKGRTDRPAPQGLA